MRKGQDCLALEHRMWALLDEREAEYPAEHNVGHLYPAKPVMQRFYEALDPCNALNPGIGQTAKCRHWRLGSSQASAAVGLSVAASYSASGNTGDGGAGRSARTV